MADGLRLEYDHREASAAIREAVATLRNPQRMFNDMGEYLLLAHKMRFQSQIAPDGTPWEPLSPAYKRVKPKNANRILFLNGYLANTMRYQTDDQGLLFGSNRPTARWHHFGTPPYTITPKTKEALSWPGGPGPRKKVNHPGLPARPIIGTSADDDQELTQIALYHLRRPFQ